MFCSHLSFREILVRLLKLFIVPFHERFQVLTLVLQLLYPGVFQILVGSLQFCQRGCVGGCRLAGAVCRFEVVDDDIEFPHLLAVLFN